MTTIEITKINSDKIKNKLIKNKINNNPLNYLSFSNYIEIERIERIESLGRIVYEYKITKKTLYIVKIVNRITLLNYNPLKIPIYGYGDFYSKKEPIAAYLDQEMLLFDEGLKELLKLKKQKNKKKIENKYNFNYNIYETESTLYKKYKSASHNEKKIFGEILGNKFEFKKYPVEENKLFKNINTPKIYNEIQLEKELHIISLFLLDYHALKPKYKIIKMPDNILPQQTKYNITPEIKTKYKKIVEKIRKTPKKINTILEI